MNPFDSLRSLERAAIFFVILLLLAVFFAGRASAQTSPTLTFTAELTRGVETITPKLTWSTTPAADSCTASGDAAWTGTKPGAGSVTLPAVNTSKTYSLVCSWPGDTARLSWTAPTQYTNGDALTVAKYTVASGTVQGDVQNPNLPSTVRVDEILSTLTFKQLTDLGAPGTYYFCLRAFDAAGTASDCSRKADGTLPSKVITADAAQTRTVTVTVDPKPKAPGALTVE